MCRLTWSSSSLAVLTRGPRTQRLQPNHVIFVSKSSRRINYTQETAEPLGVSPPEAVDLLLIKETSRLATTIEELCEEVRASVRREEFPIDVPVYERFKKDPFQPILYAGSLEAPVCIFGRDLGKDEVRLGQPLIGAGGKLVRQGVLRAWQAEGSADLVSPGELQDGAALRPSNQYGSLQAPR